MAYNYSPLTAKYVLTAYMTEADAYADANPIFVMSSTIGGLSHDTADPNQSSETVATAHSTHPDGYYHFFIFEEYWFRIESNGLCKEFEIDWDDGENNSQRYSNVTKIKLEDPQYYAVTSHIFTKHGAFYPLIRAKSMEGHMSKWYTPNNPSNDFSALANDHRISASNYDSGNNEFSVVTMEKSNQPRIPIFFPSNKPPVCVLKTDRKQVFSGIDNSFLRTATISGSTDPTVTIFTEGSAADAYVRVIYLDSGAPTGATDAGDNVRIQEAKKKNGESINNCRRILRVELVNNIETTTAAASTTKLSSGERIFIIYGSSVVITYVSLGNPVVEEDDLSYYATLDLTESRTRASNVGIHATAGYYFDMCRDRYADGGISNRQTAHEGVTPYMTSNTHYGPTTNGVQRESWSHSHFNNMLDDDNRFLPEGKLIEAQVRDTSASTKGSETYAGADNDVIDICEYSFIEHAEGKRFWNGDTDDDGTIESTTSNSHILRRPETMKNYNIIMRTYDGDTGTPTWLNGNTLVYNTAAGSELITGSSLSGTSITSGDYKTFVLIAKERKFDKIFAKVLNDTESVYSNISHQGSSDGNWPSVEMQVFYPAIELGLREEGVSSDYVRFKPLKITDNTTFNRKRGTSLCRSGIISFDAPSDWHKCKKTTINSNLGTDNFLNGVAEEWDVDSYAVVIAIGIDASSGAEADANKNSIKIPYFRVADNASQQYIEIKDPTCLSLNNLVQAQSISYTRKGKYQNITNRLGTSEIRKIGASGGKLKFGGVDLKNDPLESRKTCYRYQRDAVPVFIDTTHENGDISRFFGVITDMSEDHATAKMLPKYGLTLDISKIAEFDSSGNFISEGLVSLGGEIDKPRYVGFGGHA